MWGRRISKSFNLYERVLIGLIDFSNWSLTNARQDKGQLVFSILVWTLSTVETPSCHIDTKVQLKRVFCFLCLVVVLFQVAIQREREQGVLGIPPFFWLLLLLLVCVWRILFFTMDPLVGLFELNAHEKKKKKRNKKEKKLRLYGPTQDTKML